MMVLISAGMIVSPSYLADILIRRLKIGIGIAAVFALALFLVGVFLLIRTLKD
jgi:hypothetical protein